MLGTECKNCVNYKGNCGHHHKDMNNHINYEIPAETATNLCGDCEFYVSQSFESLSKLKSIGEICISINGKEAHVFVGNSAISMKENGYFDLKLENCYFTD